MNWSRTTCLGLPLTASVALCAGFFLLAPADLPVAESAEAQPAGTKWALLIGVDDYVHARKLSYCGADMRALRDRLLAAGFPARQVFLLDDKADKTKYRPVKQNIEREIGLVLGLLEKDDVVVVAFSGHGIHRDGKSYLCPAGGKLNDPRTLISLDDVYGRFQRSKASLKLFLVDACRDDPEPGGQRTMAPTASSRAFAESLERAPQGILLLTSCSPGEISWEDQELGHGVFMNFVLRGLEGKADFDQSGTVSLLEMAAYATKETKLHVAHRFSSSQRPSLTTKDTPDFDIVETPSGPAFDAIGREVLARAFASKLLQLTAEETADPASAINRCTEVIDAGKASAETFVQRGILYVMVEGEFEKATRDLDKATELDPKSGQVHAARGLLAAVEGDLAVVVTQITKAIELDAKNADLYAFRALFQPTREKALLDVNSAIELEPKRASLYYQRGHVRAQLEEHREALLDYGWAIKLEPRESHYYAARAMEFGALREPSKELADWNKAIELAPEEPLYYAARSEALAVLGELEKALADCNKAVDLNDELPLAYQARAQVYEAMGESALAAKDTKAAQKLFAPAGDTSPE